MQREITDPSVRHAMEFCGDLKAKRDTLLEVIHDVNQKQKREIQRKIQSASIKNRGGNQAQPPKVDYSPFSGGAPDQYHLEALL